MSDAPTQTAAPTAPTAAPPPDGIPPALETPQTPAEVRRHKVKIDGAEVEVDEPELLRGYERARGAHKRFEEAAKARKEIDARERELSEVVSLIRDPKSRRAAIARLLGGDDALREMAEEVMVAHLEREAMPEPERKRRDQMSERERAIEAEEKRLADREAKIKQAREAEVAAEAKRLQEGFVRDWPDLLKKRGVPPSRHAISRMAGVMREALSSGADMTAAEAAEIVSEEIRAEVRELASSSDAETLRALLGDHAGKITAADVARAQAQPGRVAPREQPAPAPRRSPPAGQVLTTEELRRRFAR